MGARSCFASHGFGLATNRDIAAQAGVTAPAIYQYFSSKGALYAATARAAIAEVAQHMTALTQNDSDVAVNLSRIILGLLAVHTRDPSLAAFLTAMPTELQRYPQLARVMKSEPNDIQQITFAVVERGVRLRQIDPRDSERTIAMFIACMMGLSQFAVLFGTEVGTHAATAFAELIERGLLEANAFAKPRRPAPKRERHAR
jgi:AcrR family transcriptional regulator